MERNKLIEKLRKILLKKAEGFFYTEEICEYLLKDPQENEQLSIFDTQSIKNNKKSIKENDKKLQKINLIMSKKKVTTHYIPPDMLAIKMLIENFGQEVDGSDDFSQLSDQDLLNLQNELIKQLKEESNES